MPSNPPTRPTAARADSGLEKRITMLEIKVDGFTESQKALFEGDKELRNIMYGNESDEGVLERLRFVEKQLADIKKISWAVLFVLLGLVVTSFYNIVISHPLP